MTEYNAYLQPDIPYIPGSAAPALDPVSIPLPHPHKKQHVQEKNKKRVFPYAKYYVPALVLMVIAVAGLIGSIIWQVSIRTSIASTQSKISESINILQTLTADNDAREVYMNKSIDLNQIYDIATQELGMVYPSYDQIVYYTRKDGGYVRQYENIPQD